MIIRWFFLFFLSLALFPAHAANFSGLPQFIDEMVEKHQFKREELTYIFDHAKRLPFVLNAMDKQSTPQPWPDFRDNFVNPKSIADGLAFWQKYSDALQRAEQQYGVPQQIIVALIGVETRYGANAGKVNTLDSLTMLAFDYPRRASFFRGELEQYLLLSREQDFEIRKVRGSYAGALGIPQFMPSSYRKYAVDFDGDGKIDLLNNPVDAIGSVANYFKQSGWLDGGAIALRSQAANETVDPAKLGGSHPLAEWAASGILPMTPSHEKQPARLLTLGADKELWLAFNNFDVIRSYNSSNYYAMSVFLLSESLRDARNAKLR